MTNSGHNATLNLQILEEAAEWLVEFNSGETDHAARQNFDAWLRISPEHVRAYLELLRTWEDGALLPPPGVTLDIDELIAMGRSAENVVDLAAGRARASTLAVGEPNGERPAQRRPKSPRLLAIAASVLVTVTGAIAWFTSQQGTYATGIGEQRSVSLEEGSMINLNARSRLRVRFTSEQRVVELIDGQAIFNVAKDSQRPFIVKSSDAQIRAVGTQFDVYRKRAGTTVTVIEGVVGVSASAVDLSVSPSAKEKGGSSTLPHDAAPPEIRALARGAASKEGEVVLSAGEQLTVALAKIAEPKRVDVAAATAWTERRLVFDASTLAEVVAEFNRFNRRPLVLADSSLETLPITAAFASTDPAPLVRFLEAQPDIRVLTDSDEIKISKVQ